MSSWSSEVLGERRGISAPLWERQGWRLDGGWYLRALLPGREKAVRARRPRCEQPVPLLSPPCLGPLPGLMFLLLTPHLGQQVGISCCLGPHILGLGDVEKDVHDIGGDVQGQSELGSPVILGLVLGQRPPELCRG